MYKRDYLPEKNEYVIAKVVKIEPAAAICELLEYNAEAIIPFNEVARGRVKDIRDHLREGQVVVGKVFRVNEASKTVYISLRKADERLKKAKLNEYKLEQAADIVMQLLAKKLGIPVEEVYEKVAKLILEKEKLVYNAFLKARKEGKQVLEQYGIDKELIDPLYEIIVERIALPRYTIKGVIGLYTIAPNGVELIRQAFKEFKNVLKENDVKAFAVKYQGSGQYYVKAEDYDGKKLEKALEKGIEKIQEIIGDTGEVVFEKLEE